MDLLSAKSVQRSCDNSMTRINHTALCDSSQFIAGKPFGYLG